jgi:hypothetical protein
MGPFRLRAERPWRGWTGYGVLFETRAGSYLYGALVVGVGIGRGAMGTGARAMWARRRGEASNIYYGACTWSSGRWSDRQPATAGSGVSEW